MVGLVRRAEGVQELAAQGISQVVATDSEGWRDRVASITGGADIRAGVDSVGGRAAGQVLSLLGDDGVLVAFGAMGSPVMELGSGDLIFKQAVVKGFWASRVSADMDPAVRAGLFRELIGHIQSGALTVPVAATYGFDDVQEAARADFEPGSVGKILLRP